MELLGKALWLVLLFTSVGVGLLADSQQPGAPIQIGATCADGDGSYLWITSTKSLWSIKDVAAVPLNVISPNDWSDYPSFSSSLWAGLPENPGVQDFGDRLADIGSDYFPNNTTVLVSLKRTVNTTTRIVQCEDGMWGVISSSQSSIEDDSDWIPASEQGLNLLDSTNNGIKIQGVLDMLNGQPGANTGPVDGYVHLDGASHEGEQ